MKMGMEREGLAPGVKYCEKTENEAEMTWIAADHEQRLTDGTEQDLVKETSVGKGERIEQIRDGEDHVKVRNRK